MSRLWPAAGALALVLLAAGGSALASPEADPGVARARALEAELIEQVGRFRDATVSILTKGGGAGAPSQGTTRPLPLSAVGSGVLIRYRGIWVLTNNHVVDSAGRLEIVTSDGRPHPATVKGRNTSLDLALLAFERPPAGLRPIPLEGPTPGRYQEGDWVVASGNPFFLALDGETVACWGILSGVRPPDKNAYIDAPTIQHDAEINPGSSGGPLFSAQGHLLGLNGTIATRSRTQATGPSHTGASFAVPMARIRPFLRGVLGVAVPPVAFVPPPVVRPTGVLGVRTRTARDTRGVPHGAVVTSIDAGKQAALGMQLGDLITQVTAGGQPKPVRQAGDVTQAIAGLAPGTMVTVRFERQGRIYRQSVPLTAR